MQHIATTRLAYQRVAEHFQGYDRYRSVTCEEMFDDAGKSLFRPELLDRLSGFFGVDDAFDRVPTLSKILAHDVFFHIENAEDVRDVLHRNAMLPQL